MFVASILHTNIGTYFKLFNTAITGLVWPLRHTTWYSSFASESLVHFPIKLYVPKAVLELLEHVTCKRAGYEYYTIGIDLEI